jgi:exodeoxyribonuclease VII small subunit
MARRKTNSEETGDAPSFEQALEGLEAIVEAMENEQLPLEELVACYEKGSALLDRCEQILQAARGRIELITLRNQNGTANEAGNAAPDELSPPSGSPDASDDDDDIRLF